MELSKENLREKRKLPFVGIYCVWRASEGKKGELTLNMLKVKAKKEL